jgi:hypothetical protein
VLAHDRRFIRTCSEPPRLLMIALAAAGRKLMMPGRQGA